MKLLRKLELWMRRRHHTAIHTLIWRLVDSCADEQHQNAANYAAQAMTTRQSGPGAPCRGIAVVFGACLGAKQAC